jgi:hypothetical protein
MVSSEESSRYIILFAPEKAELLNIPMFTNTVGGNPRCVKELYKSCCVAIGGVRRGEIVTCAEDDWQEN